MMRRFLFLPLAIVGVLVLGAAVAVPAGRASAATGLTVSTPVAASCTVTKLSPVLYTAIDGHTETLTPWQGPKVAVLVEPGVTRTAAVMTKLVCALNRAYTYYQHTVGRSPAPAKTLNGRDTVAEVTTTCGAGCTYIGATGTELQTTTFDNLYNEIACCNQYDQTPFYEFGRSFWFWSNQLELPSPCTDPILTGFAVWMRFRAMSAAGVAGAPFPGPGGTPFSTFKAQVQGLEGIYDSNTSDTFAGTLCADQSPGMYSGTDFFASIMMKLASLYGGQKFTSRFWQHLSSLPAYTSVPTAITNWLTEADYASCVNLSSVFYQRWGFPQPDGTVVNPRPAASTVPFPAGHC